MFERNHEQEHTGADTRHLCREWQEILGRQADELGKVAVASEKEFLSLGSRFQELWGQAQGVSTQAAHMMQVVAGEKTATTTSAITDIVARLGEYLSRLQGDMGQIIDDFQEIIGKLESAKAPLLGFGKINKVLRMIGISTKIESSRLEKSAAGFETLANDVTRLSVEVVIKSETINRQLDGLERVIGETLERVRGVEANQHAKVHTTLKAVRDSLESLETVNRQRGHTVEAVSALSAEMERNLGEIVTFMQFHDIVRQQLEHVQEAFSELGSALEKTAGGPPETLRDLVIEVGDICELQIAQLENSAQELDGAIVTITGSLTAISSKGVSLAGEARKMAGMSDRADESLFTTMENELAGVTNVLTDSAQENERLTNAMNTVIGTIGEIVSFVRDIETIGEEIELIALNAQIKAARTGIDGAGLGVLAEAIQRLSLVTMEQTAAVSHPLQDITTVTGRLQARVAIDSAAMDQDINTMINELTTSLQEISAVHGEVLMLIDSIDGAAVSLQVDIQRSIEDIAAHRELPQAIAATREAADQVVEATRRHVSPPVGQLPAERLKALAARYTMHSERKIHEVVTGTRERGSLQAGSMPHGVTPVSQQETTEGLWSNVELF